MAKLTIGDIAFTVETIAHLNSNPAIQPYIGRLLLAACIVRQATDEQLAKALDMTVASAFYRAG